MPFADDLPALDLLDSTHTFPGPYTFKVIGSTADNFMGRVVQTVRAHLAPGIEPPFSSRKTAHGRHVSVTIEPTVDDSAHVLAIYRSLSELDGLVLLL